MSYVEFYIDNWIGTKEFKSCVLTEEDIKKLCIDESWDEIQKFSHILLKGTTEQKISIFKNMKSHIENELFFSNCLKPFKDSINQEMDELQIAMAQGIVDCLSGTNINIPLAALDFFFEIGCKLIVSWKKEVSLNWLKVMKRLILKIDLKKHQTLLNNLVLNMTDSTQPIQIKTGGAKLAGALCYQKFPLSGVAFDKIRLLCNDQDKEVRIAMVKNVIYKIFVGIESDVCHTVLIQKIIEMIYDSDTIIKNNALNSLCLILDLIKPEIKRTKILNVLNDMIINLHEDVIISFSKYIGQIIQSMFPLIEKNQTILTGLINYYRELPNWKNEKIKANFLYNLPGMLTILDSKLYASIRPSFLKLFDDKSVLIRKQLVVVLPAVLQIVGTEENLQTIKLLFFKTIKDETHYPVLKKLAENFSEFLVIFKPSPTELLSPEYLFMLDYMPKDVQDLNIFGKNEEAEFSFNIAALWKKISNLSEWRIEYAFLCELEKKILFLSPVGFMNFCFSFLLQRIRSGNQMINKKCVEFSTEFMRVFFRKELVKSVVKQMVDTLHKSKSYQDRLSFLCFVQSCLIKFSREFLRTYIYTPLSESESEKIFSVKIKYLEILPTWRTLLNEDDQTFIDKINIFLKNLQLNCGSPIIKEKGLDARELIKRKLNNKENMADVESSFQKKKIEEEEKLAQEIKEMDNMKKRTVEEMTKENGESKKISKLALKQKGNKPTLDKLNRKISTTASIHPHPPTTAAGKSGTILPTVGKMSIPKTPAETVKGKATLPSSLKSSAKTNTDPGIKLPRTSANTKHKITKEKIIDEEEKLSSKHRLNTNSTLNGATKKHQHLIEFWIDQPNRQEFTQIVSKHFFQNFKFYIINFNEGI